LWYLLGTYIVLIETKKIRQEIYLIIKFTNRRYSKQSLSTQLKIMKMSVYVLFENWCLSGVKKKRFKPRPQYSIFVPLGDSIRNFPRALPSFLYGIFRRGNFVALFSAAPKEGTFTFFVSVKMTKTIFHVLKGVWYPKIWRCS